MWQDFKSFAMRGSMVDMAIGIIVGGAFSEIVNSLVRDVIMPPIGLLVGRVDASELYVNLSGRSYSSLAQARAAGAPTINYGQFLSATLDFVILAAVVFLVVRGLNRLHRAEDPPSPADRSCPHCLSSVPRAATRCPHCTSELETA